MQGTYDLKKPHQINLYGQMKMDGSIAGTTTGAKSFLLKIMDPFLRHRKHHKGEIVPVRITGTYDKPSFGLALNDKQAKAVKPPKHPRPPQ
jgi:hypothetical protein